MHRARKIWLARADAEVVVVRHHTIQETIDSIPQARVGKQKQNLLIVRGLQEQLHLSVAACHDVVGQAGLLNPKWSGHAGVAWHDPGRRRDVANNYWIRPSLQ